MNGFNLSDIQDARLGGTQLSAIYLGSSKLWPTRDYSKEYLTIESLADNNTITWTFVGSTPMQNVIYWSKNGTSWTAAIASTGNTPVSLATLNAGEKMYLKGENAAYATSNTNYTKLDAGDYFNIYGNIESLRYGDNFANILPENITINSHAYEGLFRGSHLVDASNLILPATTLNTNCYSYMFAECTVLSALPELPATTLAQYCYQYMFKGCTEITTVPSNYLPATSLAIYCYYTMFNDCTSLTTVPSDLLPATTLRNSCYENMFRGCTSLTAAPDLPATTLTSKCYSYMFRNCIVMNYIKCLATNISASNSHSNWLSGVAETGTFVKPASMTSWSSGISGIPNGWTVIDI